MKHRIGVDVDGVLANFERGFVRKLREAGCEINFPLDDPNFPEVWEWPRHHGVPPDVEAAAWQSVKRDPLFWAKLSATGTRDEFLILHEMMQGDWQVYFITTRPGLLALQQTAAWLSVRGLLFPPVLIADHPQAKGELANALSLDAIIDDRPENLLEVERLSSTTRPFLRLQPYNREWFAQNPGKAWGVNTIREMMDILVKIEQAEELAA